MTLPADTVDRLEQGISRLVKEVSRTSSPWCPDYRSAAEYTGRSVSSLKKAVAAGHIEYSRPSGENGDPAFRKVWLDAWMERNKFEIRRRPGRPRKLG
jgi:hypothetical protein